MFMQYNHFADIDNRPWYIAGIAIQYLVSFVWCKEPNEATGNPIKHCLVKAFSETWVSSIPRYIQILNDKIKCMISSTLYQWQMHSLNVISKRMKKSTAKNIKSSASFVNRNAFTDKIISPFYEKCILLHSKDNWWCLSCVIIIRLCKAYDTAVFGLDDKIGTSTYFVNTEDSLLPETFTSIEKNWSKTVTPSPMY